MPLACQAEWMWLYGQACPWPAAGLAVAGCEHEHLRERALCSSCYTYATLCMRRGMVLCGPCGSGLEPHPCQIVLAAWTPQ